MIVAHFYDVESGRKDLAERGNSQAFSRFEIPIPRDGSIKDLLAEARRPDRRFAAVVCESIERVARRTYFGASRAGTPASGLWQTPRHGIVQAGQRDGECWSGHGAG